MQVLEALSALHHMTDVILHDVNHLVNLILQSESHATSELVQPSSELARGNSVKQENFLTLLIRAADFND